MNHKYGFLDKSLICVTVSLVKHWVMECYPPVCLLGTVILVPRPDTCLVEAQLSRIKGQNIVCAWLDMMHTMLVGHL